MKRTALATAIATTCFGLLVGGSALASSHREAPNISRSPKVDASDFYMFRSYESGRAGYVTFLANYQPLQDAYGGPNFFSMDPRASYDINVDNDGDALPDITFRFHFNNHYRNLALSVNGTSVAVPLNNIGPFSKSTNANVNLIESYSVDVIRNGVVTHATNMLTGAGYFIKPHDNIGTKSIANYAQYAEQYISGIAVGGCHGRVFVGQRNDGFSVNLGEIFDLIHTNPVGPADGEHNILADKNVTTIALEMPIGCLRLGSSNPVIGAWTAASLPLASAPGGLAQVSRLSAPLINEVIIGLPDKDKFNASQPKDDGQFAKYVTNPTLPELIQALFPGVIAPNSFPRTDLVAAFLTGITGLNKPTTVTASEMMRLNTSIAPKTAVNQANLGVLAGDTAGFPNGRRPGDDVVDIELRVAMGVLLPVADAPSGQLPYTDGATVRATDFRNTFPYLNTPLPGATD